MQKIWQQSIVLWCIKPALLLSLAACAHNQTPSSSTATPPSTPNKSVEAEKAETPQVANVLNQNQTFDSKVGAAIASPLSDLNLVKADIPEILLQAKLSPYALPGEGSCQDLQKEIEALTRVLGPDVDHVKRDAQGNLIEQGSNELGNAAVNALKSFTEGVIPFRAWIRRLTGADKTARELAAAGIAGVVRRSYLKGYWSAKSCPPIPTIAPPEPSPQAETK